jgi:hypothetical protein
MKREKFRDWKKYLGAKYRVPSRWKNTDDENVPFMKVGAAPLFGFNSLHTPVDIRKERL